MGATLKECVIQISAINWGLRKKIIQLTLNHSHFKMKVSAQKDWMKENTTLMAVQRELVSLSLVLTAQKKIASAGTDTQATRNTGM